MTTKQQPTNQLTCEEIDSILIIGCGTQEDINQLSVTTISCLVDNGLIVPVSNTPPAFELTLLGHEKVADLYAVVEHDLMLLKPQTF